MSGSTMHLSEDLQGPLEVVRKERCDRTLGETARALLRKELISRGLLEEAPQLKRVGLSKSQRDVPLQGDCSIPR